MIKNIEFQLGIVGLGVMGRNLALNTAGHGYPTAGYDKDPKKVSQFRKEAGGLPVQGAEKVSDFVALLRKPRAVMMLVPAGPPVDAVIRDLLPHLDAGDLIIDAGNSHFTDTTARGERLKKSGLHFFGMGVSGGEYGARHGPSMMPGGPEEAYSLVQPVLEACAAKVDGDPCVTYLGPGAAGHYVKMVHNGIEYALMQSLAETYDLLNHGLELEDSQLADLFHEWDQGDLHSYLVGISADIFRKMDETTGGHLIEVVLDAAHQKGTGMWTSQEALSLHEPTPTIDTAVAMRNLSGLKQIRTAVTTKYGNQQHPYRGDRKTMIAHIHRALYATIILSYSQGMSLLRAASQEYGYNLDLSAVARIWRGGCIIRSALLEPISAAYRREPQLSSLLLDETLGKAVAQRDTDMRVVAQTAASLGIPAPGLMASLAYYDSLRARHLPANLIQAQRDYFGAHTYERTDIDGVFHTAWEQE